MKSRLFVLGALAMLALGTAVLPNFLWQHNYSRHRGTAEASTNLPFLMLHQAELPTYLRYQFGVVKFVMPDGRQNYQLRAGVCQLPADAEMTVADQLATQAVIRLIKDDWFTQFNARERPKLEPLAPQAEASELRQMFLRDLVAEEGFREKFRTYITASAVEAHQPIIWAREGES